MEQELSHQESLSIIKDMIAKAKKSFHNYSFHFLMWGWLLLFSGVMEQLLLSIEYRYHFIGWPIAGILGGILASIRGRKDSKEQQASSWIGKITGFVWGGFVVTLILFIIATVTQQQNPGPYITILTGLPTFISGGILGFRPLIIGGIVFWILGILSFFFFTDFQPLIFSFSIICGYLAPGYMLRRAEKSNSVKSH